jgi:hypothetical protein
MSPEEEKGEEAQFPTALQISVLCCLYYEELENFKALGTAYTSSHIVQPVALSLRQLIPHLPNLKASETSSPEVVCNQLNVLIKCRYLNPKLIYQDGHYATLFSITDEGMLFLKAYIAKLTRAMKDKKINEKDIDRAEGKSDVKKYFKETWRKIKDKSQDEIVDTFFSAIRSYGPSLVGLLAILGT